MADFLHGASEVILDLALSIVFGFGFYAGAYHASLAWPIRVRMTTIVRDVDAGEGDRE